MKIILTLILTILTMFCYSQTVLYTKISTEPVYTSIYSVSEINENDILIKQSNAIPNIDYKYTNPQIVKLNLTDNYHIVLDTSFLCVPIKSEKSIKPITKKLTIK